MSGRIWVNPNYKLLTNFLGIIGLSLNESIVESLRLLCKIPLIASLWKNLPTLRPGYFLGECQTTSSKKFRKFLALHCAELFVDLRLAQAQMEGAGDISNATKNQQWFCEGGSPNISSQYGRHLEC